MPEQIRDRPLEIIGLLPCGGQATRISPLPLSKELYPIGFQPGLDGQPRPKVVCHYLLEAMQRGGIRRAYFILRSGKWDIPAYFRDGEFLDMPLGYLMMRSPHGVPYTLDQAYAFVPNALIALGFPDILLQPTDVYTQLVERWHQTQPDVLLGLFPCDRPQKAGMVDFEPNGKVNLIIEKPQQTQLTQMWGTALWTPRFTQFLHDYLIELDISLSRVEGRPRQELPIGDVIQAAIAAKLRVEALPIKNGSYLDIGTPTDLVTAVQFYAHAPFPTPPF
ncbi:MAG: sugar phosphate nucleotidyltransferase [Leptolyngbyaceae cyanobacterium bins.349]|nr:sugar phosphate nucleotidyltransferase [Leptolyngbyaceae cyanobacterium bins.349]